MNQPTSTNPTIYSTGIFTECPRSLVQFCFAYFLSENGQIFLYCQIFRFAYSLYDNGQDFLELCDCTAEKKQGQTVSVHRSDKY